MKVGWFPDYSKLFSKDFSKQYFEFGLYCAVNNILAWIDSIQLVINSQYIPTPSCLPIKFKIATYAKEKIYKPGTKQKNMKILSDSGPEKKCSHIV